MRARLIDDKEKEKFNDFMANGPKGHILQSYEWGEIKAKTNWQPLRLVVENHAGQIVAGISILKRPLPVFGKSIFYAPRGPIIDYQDEAVFDFLLAEIKKLAKQHGAIFLKLDPDIPIEDKSVIDYFQTRGFVSAEKGEGFEGVQPKFVFRLDLHPSVDELFQNMANKTRYNIRLATKKGAEIVEECSKEELREFYRILQETCERDKFLVRSYSYFEDLWDYLVPPGYAKLFMARYEGRYIAGTLAFKFGDKAWYIYGASSNSHRNVMPNYALQWQMIQWAKEQGSVMYDFRGVPGDLSEDNPLIGLYRFKKGFNGEYTEFIGEFDLVYSPLFYKLWNTAEPLYAKGVRKLINIKKTLKGKK